MGLVSSKLRSADLGAGRRGFGFRCPGCASMHFIGTSGPAPTWSFDGNLEAPTFAPSVLVTGVHWPTDDEERRIDAGEAVEPRPLVCHSFVRAGRIEFLGDCTHELRGQTVDLPSLES